MSRTIKAALCLSVFSTIVLCSGTVIHAQPSCSGILDQFQQQGFRKMFPEPYEPSLTADGSKLLAKTDLSRLSVATPLVVRKTTLSPRFANDLKGWMNDNASSTIPGWFSTTVGAVVPQAWVGLAADVFVQLMNGSGDAGRLKVANLAGTVSEGGIVAVTEQVAVLPSGSKKFLYVYLYQANLNSKLITVPLYYCSADVNLKE